MQREFDGKVAVITGGSRGIGQGIASALAAEGARTVLVASSEDNLRVAARAIAHSGAPAPDTCAADLRRPDACERVAQHVHERHGRCDILVNSAGATRAGAFQKLDEEAWQDGFGLKFFGCVRLCRLLWPLLELAKGHVVNVIGGAARTPDPEFLIGGAVNAAMWNFSKGLAALGKRGGVNVNAILPGITETDRVQQLLQQRAEASGTTMEAVRAATLAKDGIARIGRPEDVAALAVFLCSERARHIQGTAIAVDGGATPGLY